MKLRKNILVVLVVFLAFLSVKATNHKEYITTQQAIDRFVGDSALRHASVSVRVMRMDSMVVIGEHNPYQSQITASTMKVITSATALAFLGSDFKFHTTVYANGEISENGKLKGDLLIRGGGDPTLGSRHIPQYGNFVDSLVTVLKEKGVKEIEGNVITDDTSYPSPYVPATWMIEDMGYGYGTGVHGLNFADNTLPLNVSIDKDEFEYTTGYTQSYFKVENHCNVLNEETDSLVYSDFDRRLDTENNILYLSGNIKPFSGKITVANPSPDLLLRDSVEVALKKADIKLKHKRLKQKKTNNASVLLDYTSPELKRIVNTFLVCSNNMYAECVLRAIAISTHKEPISSNSVAVVKDFWTERGVDVSGLFMYDGSGLSRTDKAPVSFFTHMLSVAEKELKSKGIDFHTLFPVVGKNGTVRRVAAGTTAEGKFALKSGSMSGVQCYVGYYPVENPKYVLAILINSFVGSRAEIVDKVSKMLVEIDGDLSKEKE